MQIKNSRERWGAVHKTFHWTVAVLVIGMLCLGLYMTGLSPSPSMFRLYALHKSVGIVILILMVLRVAWKAANTRPDMLPQHRSWERFLAHVVHGFLYAAIIAMPLSGWIMSSAKNFHVSVFGLFTLPDLVSPNERLAGYAVTFHDTLDWIIIGVLVLHVAGALKHHVIDHDSTLVRMLPFTNADKDTP